MVMGVKQGQKAFTLLEMMVVLVIIAIIAVIAYPSIIGLMQRLEAKKFAQAVHDALITGRNESWISKQNVIVCPADKENHCDKQAGYKIMVFRDNDDNHVFNEGELIAESVVNLKYGHTDMRVSASRNYIKYFGVSATPRGHFGHISYCVPPDNAVASYKMVLTHNGVVYQTGDEVRC